MSEQLIELSRLSGAEVSDDGETVRFRIESAGDETVDIACGHRDLEGIIAFMIELGRLSAEKRADVTPEQVGGREHVVATPIEISDVGLLRDLEAEEAALAVRVFGFDLLFAVTPFQLRALYREIARLLPHSMLAPSDHHHGHDHHH